jgi:hypothetical protein
MRFRRWTPWLAGLAFLPSALVFFSFRAISESHQRRYRGGTPQSQTSHQTQLDWSAKARIVASKTLKELPLEQDHLSKRERLTHEASGLPAPPVAPSRRINEGNTKQENARAARRLPVTRNRCGPQRDSKARIALLTFCHDSFCNG